MNKTLSSFNPLHLTRAPVSLGVTLTTPMTRRDSTRGKRIGFFTMTFSKMFADEVQVTPVLKGGILGCNLSLYYGHDLLRKKRNSDIIVSIGCQIGRVLLITENADRTQNPYVAPAISVQPRFKRGKWTFSCGFEFSYDLSDTKWKKLYINNNSVALPGNFNSSGLTTFLSIGKALVKTRSNR